IFLIMASIFLVQGNLDKPRVLILHSYATDYRWVRDINIGLNRILADKPYAIRWHYMDTKRNPYKSYFKKAGQRARDMIDSWKPNVIVAIDDNAQEYAAKYYVNHPTIKIVYSGVNAEPSKYQYDKANNVTGTLERIPFKVFQKVFHQILPADKRRIIHVSDNSTTSKAIYQELEQIDWKKLKLVKSLKVDTFQQWKSAIKSAKDFGDILLITHYHTIQVSDTDRNIVSPSKVIEWTKKNSSLPQIGCWGFFVDDGGMMAVAVSPYEQGEDAAKMTVELIESGKAPKSIKQKKSKLFVISINECSLKKHQIKLPDMLEAFARATNHYIEMKKTEDCKPFPSQRSQ
ncbi:MAG: ABC transporter substrate-binding protein, partial [Spirochaetota bacterium]|nr:ABC transporter substrate-binding protein [Spirochaetota bacterium]